MSKALVERGFRFVGDDLLRVHAGRGEWSTIMS